MEELNKPQLMDIPQQGDELEHYGTPRHSGRYPWGSGKDPYQSAQNFQSRYHTLVKQGVSQRDIAKQMGISMRKLRAKVGESSDEIRRANIEEAVRLKDKGYSVTAIGRRMGKRESTIRGYLDPVLKERAESTGVVVDKLEEQVKKKRYLDVGSGTEAYLGISATKLNYALSRLEERGYHVYNVKQEQSTTGHATTIKVLTDKDVDSKEAKYHRHEIKMVGDFYINENGKPESNMNKPTEVSANRLQVLYADDDPTKDGRPKDGLIEIRRGVPDLYMGDAKYAQVRIMIDRGDGKKGYLKGMCTYADDLPDGIDIRFNSNKNKADGLDKALKEPKKFDSGWIESDEDQSGNPFGSTVRQIRNPETGQISALNLVNVEGDWSKWNKAISTQVLSKQPKSIAQKQLKLDYDIREDELKTIMSISNPAVRENLLTSFAEDCDSAAVHLKAKGLPGQASHVILPFPDIPQNQIYAPNYNNGDKVVLIRYPHGGIFEIPELTVNNKLPTPDKVMHGARDAVGIHPKVAEKLSGADFDGDTVLVIPNNDHKLKVGASLEQLKNFDPKESYGPPKGPDGKTVPVSQIPYRVMKKEQKGMEMGKITNLICDMQVRGATVEANADEIARAVKHSMVVIDAQKHKLDYQRSYEQNGIAELKIKYQGGANKGASTLFSKAKSEYDVPDRESRGWDPETGQKRYIQTHAQKSKAQKDKDGNIIGYTYTDRMIKSTRMYEEKDAYNLSSGTMIESVYADYANKMKALANRTRVEISKIQPIKKSESAKQMYAEEIKQLDAALNVANLNRPLERQAQLYCDWKIREAKKNNPDLWKDKEQMKKLKNYWTKLARARTGADKKLIDITPRMWEAMNSGAISMNKLREILKNTDIDKVREYATPKTKSGIPAAKLARAKNMQANGRYSNKEIADALGLSVSTLNRALYSDQET